MNTKLIFENFRKFVNESVDFKVPDRENDEDYKTVPHALIFNRGEQYIIQGPTHGIMSHAIKHYQEFDPDHYSDIYRQAAKIYLNNSDKVYLLNTGTGDAIEPPYSRRWVEMHPSLIIKTTFDLINDKIINKDRQLHPVEAEVFSGPMKELEEGYSSIMSRYQKEAVDVDEAETPDIMDLINQKKVISFTVCEGGEYKGGYKCMGKEFLYFYNVEDGGFAVQDENGLFVTLHKLEGVGKIRGKIKGRRGTVYNKNLMPILNLN